MIARELKDSDFPALRQMYESTDFHQLPFPDLRNMLHVSVVADGNDEPVMAGYARLVPEVTLISAPGGSTHPLLKLQGIALLHDEFRKALEAKGYYEAIASVPPQLERNYGRHLQRHFGWKRSWAAFRLLDRGDGCHPG